MKDVSRMIKKKAVGSEPIKEYAQVLLEIREQIDQSQVEALTAINVALISVIG